LFAHNHACKLACQLAGLSPSASPGHPFEVKNFLVFETCSTMIFKVQNGFPVNEE
jgi:hypothetical protein